MTMSFRKLDLKEEQRFRREARKDYGPFTPISGLWHPIYQDECVKINIKNSEFVEDKDE